MALTQPSYDGLAPTGVVLKVAGDASGGQVHFAIREGQYGPYDPGDGDDIRRGTNAVFTNSVGNVYRPSTVAHGLTPETLYYFGVVEDTGTAVGGNFTTSAEMADEDIGIRHVRA